jgi:multiple sugar transport system permease protein
MGYIRRILLPLIAPTMLFAVVAAVMNYFLLFRDTYALYGDDPPRQVYMLQHFMNSNFYQLNYQRLSAAAFLTVLLLTALVAGMLLLQRRARGHVG